MRQIDRDDVLQAIEIALGDQLSHEGFKARAVADRSVERFAAHFRKTLAELPPETLVQDLLEALEP